jgi:group I intron endonuclease
MSIGIYCIENKINHKKYVGQSRFLERRMNNSHKESNVFYRAFLKYGSDNFERYVVEYCSKEELNNREVFHIKELRSHVSEEGYNISWGGSGKDRKLKISSKTRKKISENNSKYWLGKSRSQETIDKIKKTKLGTVASDKTKRKMSKSRIGKKQLNGLTSSYVGTYKRNDNGKYRASIKLKGVVYRTKSFEKEEDAAKAYDELYKKSTKSLTAPNFPNK